jgi:dihydroneopterin aldolase
VTDKIRVNRLAFYGYHGFFDEEAVLGQRFYVDIECRLELRNAGQTDDLGRSVRYDEMADAALTVASESRFKTIEALAEAIADRVLDLSERISNVMVAVEKPCAPVKAILDSVSVQIERSRRD